MQQIELSIQSNVISSIKTIDAEYENINLKNKDAIEPFCLEQILSISKLRINLLNHTPLSLCLLAPLFL